MNPLEEIIDFFVRLVRGRIDSVEIQAKTRLTNIETKAKIETAKRVNGAIDGSINKAKSAVQPGKPPQK